MRILLFIAAIFTTFLGFSQSIVITTDSLLFKPTNENQTDSLRCWITNNGLSAVEIDSVFLPEVYSHQPFYVKYKLGRTIAASDSIPVDFFFSPNQNILFQHDALVSFSYGESVTIPLHAQGIFSNNYYASTQNKIEEDLKSALKAKLSNPYYAMSYNTARDNMYATIDNTNGDVQCVYTGRTATFNTRSGATANNMNTEHTFPQSMFGSSSPMQSDIHHLFPSDATANSVRSNHPFGMVQGNGTWSSGGSKYANSTFEPRNEHKGDCARAMIYFVVRYQDYNNFFSPQEQVLRNWHLNYLPTQKAIDRNNAIENLQKNRNPFVDYPQLIHRINKISGTSFAPNINNLVADDRDVFFTEVDGQTNKKIIQKAFTNFGNTAITLSGFSFTEGTHSIKNLPSNQTIELLPGQSVTLLLEINPLSQSTASTVFSLQTTNPPSPNISLNIAWDEALNVSDDLIITQTQLYPNPTNGSFFVEHFDAIEQIKVFNNAGAEVQFSLETISTQKFRVTTLPKQGIYFIQLTSNQKVTYHQFMVL